MAALLGILAVFAGALALAGAGGGTVAAGGMALGGERLDSDVAVRVSAQDPARTLPALDLGASYPELAPALRRGSAALAQAGIDPERDLLAPFSFVVISLERSCPPPALLACRPAIRFAGRAPRRARRRTCRATSRPPWSPGSELRAFDGWSYANRRAATSPGGSHRRARCWPEWRLVDDVLVVVAGGLALECGGERRSRPGRRGGNIRARGGGGESKRARDAGPRTRPVSHRFRPC